MQIVPITFKEANEYVRRLHRHHKPVVGCKFVLGLAADDGVHLGKLGGVLVGVCIVGRPVARMLDDGTTLEVNRLCTDGTRNACSMLYGAAWRVAKALGYKRLITYTLPEEGGASLRGAGWTLIGTRGGGNWNKPSRPREDTEMRAQKLLWEAA